MAIGGTWTFNTQLTEIECGGCAGVYAISEKYRTEKYRQGGYWKCPYCGISWGYGEGENERLKKQLAQEKHYAEQKQAALRDQLQRAEGKAERMDRRRAAMKGQVTRIKNRIGKGVCPCCNRTFANLQRHMSGQHPDWTPEVEAE